MEGTSSDRVRLNVGGTIFETSVLTLTKYSPSFLAALVSDRWKGHGELFIDRDPTHFTKVLNYLRDGEEFTAPRDVEVCEELRREAQFYGLVGLQDLCSPPELREGDIIQWKPEAVQAYWRPFIRYIVDDSLNLPFVYDRNNHALARCIACEEKQDPKCSYLFAINFDDWEPMKHHMSLMFGEITQLMGDNCCMVQWDNGQLIHLPKSSLRKSDLRTEQQ